MKAFTVALPVLALALGAFAGPIAVPDAEPVEMFVWPWSPAGPNSCVTVLIRVAG